MFAYLILRRNISDMSAAVKLFKEICPDARGHLSSSLIGCGLVYGTTVKLNEATMDTLGIVEWI